MNVGDAWPCLGCGKEHPLVARDVPGPNGTVQTIPVCSCTDPRCHPTVG